MSDRNSSSQLWSDETPLRERQRRDTEPNETLHPSLPASPEPQERTLRAVRQPGRQRSPWRGRACPSWRWTSPRSCRGAP
ncbi:hypothetical protein DV515_00008583 [Chloebia gouldiae]|uniref:Uncharacterized protein n=1 Tax=Chloebia gouldiae TaxID=44316 RepID=A0A3L8SF58_CHLGU|nr:hypothetical protein DV515_00008583 [Chloebia gouldiae]